MCFLVILRKLLHFFLQFGTKTYLRPLPTKKKIKDKAYYDRLSCKNKKKGFPRLQLNNRRCCIPSLHNFQDKIYQCTFSLHSCNLNVMPR